MDVIAIGERMMETAVMAICQKNRKQEVSALRKWIHIYRAPQKQATEQIRRPCCKNDDSSVMHVWLYAIVTLQ